MPALSETKNPWLAYWESLPRGQLLFRPEAEHYVANLRSTMSIPGDAIVLDFGCGYGHVAEILASHVREIFVWDAAANMRTDAAANLSRMKNAQSWHPTDTQTRFDLILVNSVVQYMTAMELGDWLFQWQRLLTSRGRIVLSDLSVPEHSTWSDVWSLYSFSMRRGYVIEAFRKTIAERNRYGRVAKIRELFHPTADELMSMARIAKLRLELLPRNLTHFKKRYSVILTLDS